MSDIRDQIVDDRGTIKRLQLIFPGYHGYRVNEDLRDADIYLKDELYKKMLSIIDIIKDGEAGLVSSANFKALESVGKIRSEIQMLAADIKHHTAGYSGISAPIRVNANKISSLYDLDMQIFQQIVNLNELANKFYQDAMGGVVNPDSVSQIMNTLSNIRTINDSREKLLYGGV